MQRCKGQGPGECGARLDNALREGASNPTGESQGGAWCRSRLTGVSATPGTEGREGSRSPGPGATT